MFMPVPELSDYLTPSCGQTRVSGQTSARQPNTADVITRVTLGANNKTEVFTRPDTRGRGSAADFETTHGHTYSSLDAEGNKKIKLTWSVCLTW